MCGVISLRTQKIQPNIRTILKYEPRKKDYNETSVSNVRRTPFELISKSIRLTEGNEKRFVLSFFWVFFSPYRITEPNQ